VRTRVIPGARPAWPWRRRPSALARLLSCSVPPSSNSCDRLSRQFAFPSTQLRQDDVRLARSGAREREGRCYLATARAHHFTVKSVPTTPARWFMIGRGWAGSRNGVLAMCDYSLHAVRNRPAKVGERLVTTSAALATQNLGRQPRRPTEPASGFIIALTRQNLGRYPVVGT